MEKKIYNKKSRTIQELKNVIRTVGMIRKDYQQIQQESVGLNVNQGKSSH